MGLKQEIDFSDLAQVTREISNIEIRASDIRGDAANGIRLILLENVDLVFESAPPTETGGIVYGGVEWRSLTESYLINNPRRYNGQIYRDTGELLQSLTSEGSPYQIYEIGESYLIFGTALAKAGRLNRSRPFVFWHTALIEKIAQFLANYIGGA